MMADGHIEPHSCAKKESYYCKKSCTLIHTCQTYQKCEYRFQLVDPFECRHIGKTYFYNFKISKIMHKPGASRAAT